MKIVKWMKWLAVVGLVVLLGACGDSGGSGGGSSSSSSEKSVAKSDEASIKVSDGEYIIPNGEKVDEEEGFLALSVTIKNESKDPLMFSSEDISLYDADDNKIAQERVYDDNNSFKAMDYGNISGGKTFSGYVVFKVDKDVEYTLTYQPILADYSEELEEVEMKINSSDYRDESDEITKLVSSYVDTVFMEKSEAKGDLKLTNDLEAENKAFKEHFTKVVKKNMTGVSVHEPTDEEASKIIAACVGANKEKAELAYTISELFPESAVVYVTPKTIQFGDIDTSSIVDKFVDEKMDTYDTYDYEIIYGDAERFFLNEMPTLINATAVSDQKHMSGEGYKVYLTLKKDEWTIDTSSSSKNYDYKYLLQAFSGGLYDN